MGQKVKFHIEEARLNRFINEAEKKEDIYAILIYKQGEEHFEHRTSIIHGSQNTLKW
jgi:hypothetical protein